MGNSNEKNRINQEWNFICFNNKIEKARELIDKREFSEPNPIFFCSENYEIMKFLLNSGISPNLKSLKYNNGTPLHQTAFTNNPETLKLLIEEGGNIFLKDDDGETPYSIARNFSRYKTMGVLREEMVKQNFDVKNMNSLEYVCQEEFFDFFDHCLEESQVQSFSRIKKKFYDCLKGAFNKDEF
eukprot:gene9158-1246_t